MATHISMMGIRSLHTSAAAATTAIMRLGTAPELARLPALLLLELLLLLPWRRRAPAPPASAGVGTAETGELLLLLFPPRTTNPVAMARSSDRSRQGPLRVFMATASAPAAATQALPTMDTLAEEAGLTMSAPAVGLPAQRGVTQSSLLLGLQSKVKSAPSQLLVLELESLPSGGTGT
jgi:hypothetical protein